MLSGRSAGKVAASDRVRDDVFIHGGTHGFALGSSATCASGAASCPTMEVSPAGLPIAVLSGCAAFQGYPERSIPLATDLRELNDSIAAARITECLGQADRLACRNKFTAARMYATDIRFSEFEKLFRQTRESGFAATLATLGLTTTAAFTTGGAPQVLSGIAAFIIGGREAFQKEVLAERTVVAIHTAMRARRAQVRLRLRNGLRQSADQYPVAVALADLNDYYDAGTILGALVGITETVRRLNRQRKSFWSWRPYRKLASRVSQRRSGKRCWRRSTHFRRLMPSHSSPRRQPPSMMTCGCRRTRSIL